MFFAFSVSPKRSVKKQIAHVPVVEDIAELKLAPFAASPKLFFEDVKIGDCLTKKLLVTNPNSFRYKLIVTKLPPAERNVVVSWVEQEVEPESDVLLELSWTPREEGSWRDVLSIVDSRNVKRDIAIVFKSVARKAKKRTVGGKTKSSISVKAIKSPIKKFRSPKDMKKKRSPMKIPEIIVSSKSSYHNSPSAAEKKNTFIFESDKENSPMLYRNTSATFKSSELPLRDTTYHLNSSANLSPCSKQITPRRKNTYTINSDKQNSSGYYQQSSLTDRNISDLSLNKLSFLDKINQLNNSSVFISPSKINFKDDNTGPTPVRRETYNIQYQPVIQIISPTFSDNADNFNDSLELERKVNEINFDTPREISFTGRRSVNSNKCDDLLMKLQSESFAFTPVTKNPRNVLQIMPDGLSDISEVSTTPFNPTNCSTEMKLSEKSNGSNVSEHFSNPRKLFKANNTYELSPDMQNISSGTYTHNVSGGTFIMGNLSSSTCIGLSPEFKEGVHDKDLSGSDKLLGSNRINTSSPVPIFPQASPVEMNANYMLNFSGMNARAALSCIAEEELTSDTHSFLSTRNMSTQSNVAASKRKSDQQIAVSPPKRAFIKPKSPPPRKLNTSWSKKCAKPDMIRKRLRLNTSAAVHSKSIDAQNTTVHTSYCDPFLIATIYSDSTVTTSSAKLDPFISSSLYYDEKWLDKQMNELKKWLNALLTPPSELNASAESKKVDVARLWQDCVKKNLIYAPSKEKVSSLYHVNHRLDGLRKAARTLFHSIEMKTVLSKVALAIGNKQLAIRDDKNLHLDVGLQSHVMLLLLCYNPLWLRIGLETIYGETIPLDSNSDVIGLSTFIVLRFFRDPYLMPKNKTSNVHNMYLPTYGTSIKKFTLKKFFMLVYFLDQAKTNKLIAHDPCLFCKDAPVKESRELLLSFSRELLSAIGDVTKFLRRLGYAVGHKQSYIDEFDYAVKSLGVDLRDGIRLTKVMEIILLEPNLSNQLRGPAISRLQKIHNVKVAMDSLEAAGYEIAGDITPKDIVDGHREKTLSFLWQIIYKFQSPRLSQAAIKIQLWWRSLNIVIKRRILQKPYLRKIVAATKIQRFYRAWKLMQDQRAKFLRSKQAAVTIQRFTRTLFLAKRDRVQYLVRRQAVLMIQQKYRAMKLMREQRQNYLQIKNAAIRIQQYFRSICVVKQVRRDYLKLTDTVVKIQRIFRARKDRIAFVEQRNATIVIQRYVKATWLMRAERKEYVQRKKACVTIQRYFRATLAMKKERTVYVELRTKVIWMQQHYRSLKAMQIERTRFLQRKQAIIIVQRYFRTIIIMKKQRQQYLLLKQTVLQVQQRFRANVAMKKCRNDYEQLKNATIVIQQRFRANKTMKEVRTMYLQQRAVAIAVQQRFRANVAMKKYRSDYQQLRQATVMLQQKLRANKAMKEVKEMYTQQRNAAIVIQQQFRAHVAMIEARETYLQQRRAVTTIQRYFKAYLTMKQCKNTYQKQRNAVITIQHWYKSIVAMKRVRTNYLQQKQVIITIQRRYRATVLMNQDRTTYMDQRRLILMVQQQFRANSLMKQARENYLKQKQAATIIQQRFRAALDMKQCRETYVQQRKTIIMLQQRFRANWAMKQARENYLKRRKAIIMLQQRFRANKIMKRVRKIYLQQKQAATLIQQRFRAIKTMRILREMYCRKVRAIEVIQQRFRATIAMRNDRETYLKLSETVIQIQRMYRANLNMKKERKMFLETKRAAVTIQQRFRAQILMKQCRQCYLQQREATVILQQKFRALKTMKVDKEYYRLVRTSVVTIQQQFKSYLLMKKVRADYVLLKRTTMTVQQRFRANRSMKETREKYHQQRRAIIMIQRRFRANLAMRQAREKYLQQIRTILMIQRQFRAHLAAKQARENHIKQIKTVLMIQRRFRANLAMKQTRNEYLQQIGAIKRVQQRFRANLVMKIVRAEYLQQRSTIITVQRRFRANLAMKQARTEYLQRREATITIQQRFRVNLCMRQCRDVYLEKRNVIINLQQRFRANVAMKKARDDYMRQRRAAVVLQRHFRANVVMKNTRLEYVNVRNNVIMIQRWFKNIIVAIKGKRQYLLEKQSACLVQRYFRGYLEMRQQRRMFLHMRQSTVIIQRYFRSYLLMKTTRTVYIERKTSVVKIQRYYRGYLLMKRVRSSFLQRKYATGVIQKYFRMYRNRQRMQQENRKLKAAVTIQSWMRMLTCKKLLKTLRANSVDIEEKKQQRKMSAAASKIQALWRGYQVRSVENQKMTRIRQRTIEAANRALPDQTAGERNREAIEILTYHHSTSMKEIIRALTILDFTTRLFPVACLDLCDRIVERLYLMLACTNRSVPDMDACVLSVSVLINLVKYKPTSAAVWKVNFLDTLLSEILHWSNKDGLLFPYACTLLWLLAQDPDHCKVILSEQYAEKMLRKAYQECERRQKMLSRLKKAPANTIQKPSIGSKTFAKKPNQNYDTVNQLSTPSLTPDWGIINKLHPRTFQDSMFAIKCVLKTLNITH